LFPLANLPREAAVQPKASIGCKVSKDGRVTVMLIHEGMPQGGVDMPGQAIGGLVTVLLTAAMDAAKLQPPADANAPRAGTSSLIPTGIGLSQGEAPGSVNLIIRAGMAQFGITVSHPRSLAKALLEAAPEGSSG
jgi:hypothetical protein